MQTAIKVEKEEIKQGDCLTDCRRGRGRRKKDWKVKEMRNLFDDDIRAGSRMNIDENRGLIKHSQQYRPKEMHDGLLMKIIFKNEQKSNNKGNPNYMKTECQSALPRPITYLWILLGEEVKCTAMFFAF